MEKDSQDHSVLDFRPKGAFHWRKYSWEANRWGPEEGRVSWSYALELLKHLLQGTTANFLQEHHCELLAPCAVEAQRQQIQLSGYHISNLHLGRPCQSIVQWLQKVNTNPMGLVYKEKSIIISAWAFWPTFAWCCLLEEIPISPDSNKILTITCTSSGKTNQISTLNWKEHGTQFWQWSVSKKAFPGRPAWDLQRVYCRNRAETRGWWHFQTLAGPGWPEAKSVMGLPVLQCNRNQWRLHRPAVSNGMAWLEN